MEFSSDHVGREQEIMDLFTQTFTASEGPEEGAIIGGLAKNLLESTPFAHSGIIRPLIPITSGHPYRFDPAGDSGASGHP